MIRELKRSDFANPLKKKLTHARESFLQEKKHQKAVVTWKGLELFDLKKNYRFFYILSDSKNGLTSASKFSLGIVCLKMFSFLI